ncbi:MAG: class I SAM-dependent methyltransferase [Sumerlaeia bacterium]
MSDFTTSSIPLSPPRVAAERPVSTLRDKSRRRLSAEGPLRRFQNWVNYALAQVPPRFLTPAMADRDAQAMASLSALAGGFRAVLPSLRGYGLTPQGALHLAALVQGAQPRHIVECGSGVSTVIFAAMLRNLGAGGCVTALENDPVFAEQTRDLLRRHRVDEWARVVDAPLAPITLTDKSPWPWYAINSVAAVEGPIDFLLVDGPPGKLRRQARYPALPVFASRLAPGALVVLDDVNRRDESKIVARWQREFGLELIDRIPADKGMAVLRRARA